MFYNRVYFTCRQTYQLLKHRPNYNRKMVTSNNFGGGNNNPKNNYIIKAIFAIIGIYVVNRSQ